MTFSNANRPDPGKIGAAAKQNERASQPHSNLSPSGLSTSPVRTPFGAFKGQPIHSLPDTYLRKAARTLSDAAAGGLYPDLQRAVFAEVRRRAGSVLRQEGGRR